MQTIMLEDVKVTTELEDWQIVFVVWFCATYGVPDIARLVLLKQQSDHRFFGNAHARTFKAGWDAGASREH